MFGCEIDLGLFKMEILRLYSLILVLGMFGHSGDCEIHATIIRQVENDGFHRDVHSLVEIIASHPTLSEDCALLLVETLPSGLYVNPDQLADLRRMGQVQSCPSKPVDVEMSQRESSPVTVQIHSQLNESENLLSAIVTLPVHLRYHSPSQHGGYSWAVLGAPSLLLRCKEDLPIARKKVYAPCKPCSQDMCQWHNVSYKTNSPKLVMQVPIGNIGHYPLVAVVTLLVTCGGCFYILSALAGSGPYDHEKDE